MNTRLPAPKTILTLACTAILLTACQNSHYWPFNKHQEDTPNHTKTEGTLNTNEAEIFHQNASEITDKNSQHETATPIHYKIRNNWKFKDIPPQK